jgi:Flp pilus assembly protein TadG
MLNKFRNSIAFFTSWLSGARARWRDDAGAAIVLVAIAIVPLIGFVGVGTDAARGYLVKSRLSSALDAAGLAGGRSFFLPTRDADINMFFNANFPAGYLAASINGPNISVDEEAEVIYLNASATFQTTFMRVLGFNEITVYSETEVTRELKALDVVLAIDMSASMTYSAPGGGTRIQAARDAASELIEILFGNNGSNDLLNIGLVPWGGKVKVTLNGTTYNSGANYSQPVSAFTNPVTGAAQSTVYFAGNSPVPMLSNPPANWKGCVYNRYLYDADDDNDADVYMPPFSVGGADWMAWEPVGPEGEPASPGNCSMAPGFYECTPCPDYGVTPLQNEKQVILDAVEDLVNPNGNTNIPAGLGWAWRVVKPEAPFTEADPNPPYKRDQAIVLLTDGENFAGYGDGYKAVFGYGGAGQDEMDDRLLELAANIKADGVIVYVIQFAFNGTALQALLKNVASGPNSPYYHFAPDAATLSQVFREVANHLSELRLSK